jgi:hypothetical protein
MIEHLPESFDFYHLGRVERAEPESDSSFDLEKTLQEESSAWGYRVHGDAPALVVLLFDRVHDSSVYMELGNILASRIATGLSAGRVGVGVMISPPQALSVSQIRKLTLNRQEPLHRRYFHRFGADRTVAVDALILPVPSEGTGNA